MYFNRHLILDRQNKRDAIKVLSKEDTVKNRPAEALKLEEEKGKAVKIIKQIKIEKEVKQEVKATQQDIETAKQKIKTIKELINNQKEDKHQEEEQFQLKQQMTHVLEDKIQDVMTQIWKTLPEVSSSDAERRRGVGRDDIKKVLSDDVTKSSLNLSKPLIVKIQFSCRPENGFLTKFLQTYNIISFKRINQESNTFAAKLDTITDFDNICTAKDLRCGSAQLKVKPFYKLTKCHDKLKTIANKTQHNNNVDTSKVTNEKHLNVKNSSKNIEADKKEVINRITTVNKREKQKKYIKLENKYKMNEIKYENDIFEEINELDPDLNEEMSDDEILALISGGVVVDQCSESDQE